MLHIAVKEDGYLLINSYIYNIDLIFRAADVFLMKNLHPNYYR